MKGWRKLTIGTEEWLYRINENATMVRSPGGKTSRVTHDVLLGCTPDEVERMQWKGSWVQIGPAMIVEYIQDHHVELV